MTFWILLLSSVVAWAEPKVETFVIQVNDRSMSVLSPETKKSPFAVIVENRSLSDQIGKFLIGNKILKHVSIKAGETESVEIENKTNVNVVFVPMSPAFQEAELVFGKKAYEIPSKE